MAPHESAPDNLVSPERRARELGDGQLLMDPPGEDDKPDVFVSNPSLPVPTRGGAMLVGGDVHPNGLAYVSDGIDRIAYPPTAEGRPIETPVELWPTSMVFRRGHRIRIEIAGSNFPRFDRNPHTGDPAATARTLAPATQAVHHEPHAPSRLTLPVMPDPRSTP